MHEYIISLVAHETQQWRANQDGGGWGRPLKYSKIRNISNRWNGEGAGRNAETIESGEHPARKRDETGKSSPYE